jgi:wyosine [tRNA(Phe)-imidazoG37] synthetase (radical SAM superfamily)
MRLTPKVHDRDAAGLTYVYPVVSRRAGGVSVGINLNPNNACNWRCIYCQVPGLVHGKGPPIDLELLERELTAMLSALLEGDYMEKHVPEGSRRLNDVAFSGNGEPTSSPAFAEAIALATRVLASFEGTEDVKLVLITNGSLVHRADVQEGLRRLAAHPGGRAWFKVDSGTDAGQAALNQDPTGVERTERNLATCARIVPTWIQTMVLARDGAAPDETERRAYLDLLRRALDAGVRLEGVLLYGLARRSYQPEAPTLSPLPKAWMEAFAEEIRALGLPVQLSL